MDTSKKSDSPPAVKDRRRYHVLDWFFVAGGVVMLAFYLLPDYYTSSNPSADFGFFIALAMLSIWMGAIGLRGAGSTVQIWLLWTLVALFWIPMFHPSSGYSAAGTYRDLLDALTFTEPIASAFLYLSLLAIVIAATLLIRAKRREARRAKLEAAGVDVEGD